MQLDMAQKHVSMAVDMAIAEKAEVFIGNGVSFNFGCAGTYSTPKLTFTFCDIVFVPLVKCHDVAHG